MFQLITAWGTPVAEVIPATAWEQAAIVCLFIVAIVITGRVLVAVLKELNKERTDKDKVQLDTSKDLLNQMTTFISQRDTQWQDWQENQMRIFNLQNDHNVSAIREMGAAVTELTKAVASLTDDFRMHDSEERVALNGLLTRKPSRKTDRGLPPSQPIDPNAPGLGED